MIFLCIAFKNKNICDLQYIHASIKPDYKSSDRRCRCSIQAFGTRKKTSQKENVLETYVFTKVSSCAFLTTVGVGVAASVVVVLDVVSVTSVADVVVGIVSDVVVVVGVGVGCVGIGVDTAPLMISTSLNCSTSITSVNKYSAVAPCSSWLNNSCFRDGEPKRRTIANTSVLSKCGTTRQHLEVEGFQFTARCPISLSLPSNCRANIRMELVKARST